MNKIKEEIEKEPLIDIKRPIFELMNEYQNN